MGVSYFETREINLIFSERDHVSRSLALELLDGKNRDQIFEDVEVIF